MSNSLYLETSVVSYLVARPSRDAVVLAHQQLTRDWWTNRRGDFEIFISELVIQEASAGDPVAARARLDVLAEIPALSITTAAADLARKLMQRHALPKKAAEDALHIAVATLHGMEYLLTGNCRHIANAETQDAIQSTCLIEGYRCPRICTPELLMGE